jgi:hypothetical protein
MTWRDYYVVYPSSKPGEGAKIYFMVALFNFSSGSQQSIIRYTITLVTNTTLNNLTLIEADARKFAWEAYLSKG